MLENTRIVTDFDLNLNKIEFKLYLPSLFLCLLRPGVGVCVGAVDSGLLQLNVCYSTSKNVSSEPVSNMK